MRILTASLVLGAVVFLSGCVTFQRYPAYGTVAAGRLVLWDRTGAHNVLPPSGRYHVAQPTPAPHADPVR
jgi:hypothetical protein